MERRRRPLVIEARGDESSREGLDQVGGEFDWLSHSTAW